MTEYVCVYVYLVFEMMKLQMFGHNLYTPQTHNHQPQTTFESRNNTHTHTQKHKHIHISMHIERNDKCHLMDSECEECLSLMLLQKSHNTRNKRHREKEIERDEERETVQSASADGLIDIQNAYFLFSRKTITRSFRRR